MAKNISPLSIDVRADIRAATKYLNVVQSEIDRAAVMALNRVAVTVRAEASRTVAKASGMKVGEVKAKMPIAKADKASLTAVIFAKPWAPNLIRYAARETRAGVSAKAWGQRKIYKGAFIGNKGRTVFSRVGENRLPIKALFGPSVPKEFLRKANVDAMTKVVATRFPLEFARAMTRVVK
jgi:hypothetical protein